MPEEGERSSAKNIGQEVGEKGRTLGGHSEEGVGMRRCSHSVDGDAHAGETREDVKPVSALEL